MHRKLYLAAALCAASFAAAPRAHAQGCIVSRSNGQVGGPESEGGYLTKGEWNVGIGYRHQFSFRHFVGDVEQTYRIQQGTQVMNKINLENFNVTYQATDRFGFTLDAPLLLASRRSHNSPYTTTAQGFGDVNFGVNGWVLDPRENYKGNVQFSLSLSLPSGSDKVTNVVDAFDGKGPHPVVLDYSVQPGTGGYGLTWGWASFRNVGPAQVYFNGSYTATPQDTTRVLRSTTSTNPLTRYASISDQYLLEAGVAYPLRKVPGLTLTFGPRWEGVPAHDLIGDSNGFRRPGYAVSLEPGFQYARARQIFSFNIARAILRDRTRSVPDLATGGHGDAAFADWVWLASYNFRFGGRHRAARHDMQPACS